jgi:hypothetical protein
VVSNRDEGTAMAIIGGLRRWIASGATGISARLWATTDSQRTF